MAVPQKNAGDRFNGSQARELSVLKPSFDLGRPMEMPRGGPLDSQQQGPSQPIPTQGQQGFMGSRQGAASKFVPMQGAAAPQRLQPRSQPAPEPPPELSGGEEEHVFDIHGVAPDGSELVATFGAVFPRGTRILGARERGR